MTRQPIRLPRPAFHRRGAFLGLVLAGALTAQNVSALDHACTRPMADALPLLENMERAWDEVSDYTTTLVKTERFVDGTITNERGFIKFRKPDQIYLHVQEGANAGAELLYPKPGTDDVILGRPGGVPGKVAGFLVNLPAIGRLIPHEFNLDDGRLMDGQHHPLPDSTIAGMMRLISTNVRTALKYEQGTVCFHPIEAIDGHPSVKVEVLFPAEAGTWHTVSEGETLWTIGGDYEQDRYVIFYNNASVDPMNALPTGEKVFVPRYYAPRALVWISEAYQLPVKLQMFDAAERTYEAYSNTNLRVDVGLSDEDFDPVLHGFPAVTTSDGEPVEAQSDSR